MAKTLQEQYRLLKEGKSDATDVFLKSAQSLFPQFVTNYATFDEAATILKQRGVINENFVGLKPTNAWESRAETDYEKAYKNFLKEAEETKKYEKKYYAFADRPDKKFLLSALNFGTDGKALIKNMGGTVYQDYPGNFLDDLKSGKIIEVPFYESLQEAEETKIKADSKKVAKEVEDALESNWDNEDVKNADNLNFNEILKGYNAERYDAKNADKTTAELIAIVLKNLSKDELFYVKNGQFGVKGLGYTDQAPGLKASKTDQMTKVDNPNSIANITKANTKDVTDKLPKSKIKDEMTYATKSQKGVAKMDPQGTKEKKIKLSEMLEDPAYIEPRITEEEKKTEDLRSQGYKFVSSYNKEGKKHRVWKKDGEFYLQREDGEVENVGKNMPMFEEQKTSTKTTTQMNENKKNLLEGLYLGMGNSAKRNSLVEYYNNFIKEEEQPVAEEPKTEAKKKMPLADRLKEIEKLSELTALEEKINALDEEITTRNERLQVAEGEDISEFVSPSKLKELKKEIKELEKLKEKYNKELTKKGGKKKEMIDETEELQESSTGDAPISDMSREDLVDYLNISSEEASKYSDEQLKDMASEKTSDMMENDTQSLNESVDPFKAFKRFLRK